MTKITIFRNHDGEYLGFDCLGHAGYADEGEKNLAVDTSYC